MIIRDPNRTPLVIPTRRQSEFGSLEQLNGERQHAIYDTDYKGDNLIAHHVQFVSPHQELVHNIVTDGANGWTHERKFQQLAHVPDLLWVKLEKRYGEGWYRNDQAFSKWLNSEEGKPYKIARNA